MWLSTAGVTRKRTFIFRPLAAQMPSSRDSSWRPSTMIRPMPASTAISSSAGSLLLPLNSMRSGGKPA